MTDAPAAVTLVADTACGNAEGPLWHPDERRLYWTDIPNGKLYRLDPATGKYEIVYDDRTVGGFTIQADGRLLLFRDRGNVAVFDPAAGRVTDTVIDELPDEVGTRFNDVFADPAGRVYCGTMATADRSGRLYRLDPDGSIRELFDGIGCSNGMGLTPDHRGLYYTDSDVRHIYRFDYDPETGDLSNRRVFVETPDGEGVPDGMTVDAEGCVWSARWDGHAAFRYGPQGGDPIQTVPVPVHRVSCVTFGGDDLATLYLSTTGGHQRPDLGEHAGGIFACQPGVKGVPECRSRVGL